MRRFAMSMFLFLIWGCGGATAVKTQDTEKPTEDDATQDAEKAIGIVRASLDAMGGLERLRLKGAKATIFATGVSGDDSIPIEITVDGPDRWRFDYIDGGLSYIYSKGICRKIVYEIPARCTPSEERWMEPLQLIQGLVFPASDAANLGATFRDKGETKMGDASVDAIELRKRNSNLRLNAYYDKETNLLAQVDFDQVGDPEGEKVKWSVQFSDWRDVDGIKVPFSKTVSRNGGAIWAEKVEVVDLSAENNRFDMPPPPTTDHPLTRTIPARRLVVSDVDGQKVEIPAPHTALGAGPDLRGEPVVLPQIEAVRMVVKTKTEKIQELKKSFAGDVVANGDGGNEAAHVLLFEQPLGPDDPVLMMIYTLAPPPEEGAETAQ